MKYQKITRFSSHLGHNFKSKLQQNSNLLFLLFFCNVSKKVFMI